MEIIVNKYLVRLNSEKRDCPHFATQLTVLCYQERYYFNETRTDCFKFKGT